MRRLPTDWKQLLFRFYADDPVSGCEDWVEVMIEELEVEPTKLTIATLQSFGAKALNRAIERGEL